MWEDPFKAGNRYVHSTQTSFDIPAWDGDNEISSVWNRTGQKLTIFDNDDYTGTRICLNAGEYVAELGPERSFDNEAESYKLANNCL
ncbi:peptidase inhibitor family I36 protein [Micromonospora sp. CPCC 206060]|uniref:peptidase inhibitor family I36 protein n=1 Tax=Micromonospora sp. CPCC 206060 TaxID=3122406 RepID=UPI002FF19415